MLRRVERQCERTTVGVGVDGNLRAVGCDHLRVEELGVEPGCRTLEGNDVAPVSSKQAERVFNVMNGEGGGVRPHHESEAEAA
jgi:hypothetical protein